MANWKGKLANLGRSMLEVVAPTPKTDAERFADAWDRVSAFFRETPPTEEIALEQTVIPTKLEEMVNLLVNEDRELGKDARTADAPGPCLEYFVENRLLETLAQLARANYPPGMHSYVLRFLVAFLQNMRQKVLPHMAVHKPLNKLILTTLESIDARGFPAYVKLLQTLTVLLHRDPSMVGFLVAVADDGAVSLPLLKGLVTNLTPRAGGTEAGPEVVGLARGGIITLLALESDFVFQCCVRDGLPDALARGLSAAYTSLPSQTGGSPQGPEYLPLRESARFVAQVANLALPTVVHAIGEELARQFLPRLLPGLLSSVESLAHTAIIATLVLAREIDHPLLVGTLAVALLGEPNVRGALIRRGDSLSPLLSLATLHLFQTLLGRFSPPVADLLFGNELAVSGAAAAAAPLVASMHSAMEALLGLGLRHLTLPRAEFARYLADAAHRSTSCIAAYARYARVAQALEHAAATEPGAVCKTVGGDARAAAPASEAQAGNAAPVSEPLFVRVLFNRLEQSAESDLDSLLVLADILTTLAAYPNAAMQALLLSAAPPPAGMRTLFGVLSRLGDDVAARAALLPGFDALVAAARKRLAAPALSGDHASDASALELDGRELALQSAVVTGELAFDLAAVLMLQVAAVPELGACSPPAFTEFNSDDEAGAPCSDLR